MSFHSKKIVALILAAGESKRMGKPKQVLPYGNSTLLIQSKEHLTPNIVEQTFIVLGAYADEIIRKCNLKPYEYFVFDSWMDGMGSSLSYACSNIFKENDYDGLLVTVGDLPWVDKSDYSEMIKLFNSTSDIIATKTSKSIGVPAIFGSDYFEELKELSGKKGAKPLILEHSHKVKFYFNEKALKDIDTPKDFKLL